MVEFGVFKITPSGKVLLIAHDAGGAELILSWILTNKRDFIVSLSGPAKKIFSKKIKNLKNTNYKKSINECDWVLTGSGWHTNFEYNAIDLAKNKNKKVITLLDHWVLFRERFVRKNRKIFPNEIWVCNNEALRIAKKRIPEVKLIKKIDNFYFKKIKDKLKKYPKIKKTKSIKILYVTEPLSKLSKFYKHTYKLNYDEFEALEYFFNNIKNFKNQSIRLITIRPHPSERVNKYSYLIKKYKNFKIVIKNSTTLINEIINHNWIVGCNTTPMVIGILNKNKVFSSIPKKGTKSYLPFKQIKNISSINN